MQFLSPVKNIPHIHHHWNSSLFNSMHSLQGPTFPPFPIFKSLFPLHHLPLSVSPSLPHFKLCYLFLLKIQWGGIRGLATTSWSQPGCTHTASAFSMSWPHLLGMLPKRSLILTYKVLSKLIQQAFYLKPSPEESVQWVFSLLSRSL